jgi:hypothetical protein
LRHELLDPKIAEHRGRIVKTTGDGLLVEFASVVDAVRYAVAVQQAMPERRVRAAFTASQAPQQPEAEWTRSQPFSPPPQRAWVDAMGIPKAAITSSRPICRCRGQWKPAFSLEAGPMQMPVSAGLVHGTAQIRQF